MTLNQQNRARLANLCNELRQDWPAALTADGIVKLDQQHPNDPLLVAALTIAAARNPAANGPAFMLGKSVDPPAEAVVRALPTPPRHDDPECVLHGSNILDDQGRHVCCVQEAATPKPLRPVPAPLREAGPCPDSARELIEAQLGPRRRAREQAQAKEQQG